MVNLCTLNGLVVFFLASIGIGVKAQSLILKPYCISTEFECLFNQINNNIIERKNDIYKNVYMTFDFISIGTSIQYVDFICRKCHIIKPIEFKFYI